MLIFTAGALWFARASDTLHGVSACVNWRATQYHELDCADDFGTVDGPFALAKKFSYQASSFHWTFLFPSDCRCMDSRSGEERRHHVHPSALERRVGYETIQELKATKPQETCTELAHQEGETAAELSTGRL